MVMKTNTKTNSWARVALGATAALALAGQAHAATYTVATSAGGTGAGSCALVEFDAGGLVVGNTAGTAGRLTVHLPAEAALSDCKAAPGYYIVVDADGANDSNNLKVLPVPTTHYGTGGAVVFSGAVLATPAAGTDYAAQGMKACPTNTATKTPFGKTTLSDCLIDGGYYISTKATSTSDATGLVLTKVPLNYYSLAATTACTRQATWDGITETLAAAEGAIKCPANSHTSATGAATLATCNINAGYWYSTKANSATDATGLVLALAPANFYITGSTTRSVSDQTAAWDGSTNDATATAAGATKCPSNSGTRTVTGSTALTACKTDAGYYLSVAGVSNGAGTITAVPTSHYSTGGVDVTATGGAVVLTPGPVTGTSYTTANVKACPTGFVTSGAGAGTARELCKKTFAIAASSTTDAGLGSATNSGASGVALHACPEGTSATAFTVAANGANNAASFCHATLAGYYGVQGVSQNNAASGVTVCPTSSTSVAASTTLAACKCIGGYAASETKCAQCPANTYRAVGDPVGTVTTCLGCGDNKQSNAGASECTVVPTTTSTTTTTSPAAGAPAASGASSVSVFAAAAAIAAAQLVL